ncbi:MAG: hypothetical protein AAGB26_07480 [Planctomycetota bacterium]
MPIDEQQLEQLLAITRTLQALTVWFIFSQGVVLAAVLTCFIFMSANRDPRNV